MLLISMSDKNVYKNHVFKTASIFPGISELKVVRLYLYLMWKSDNSVLSTIDKDMGEHGLICQYLGATVSLCLSVYKLILALHQNTVLISHCGPIAISSGKGLAQNRCQVITHTNIDLSSIGSLGINFNEILIKIQIFFIEKKNKMKSATCQPFCLGLNGLDKSSWLIHLSLKCTAFMFVLLMVKNYRYQYLHIQWYIIRSFDILVYIIFPVGWFFSMISAYHLEYPIFNNQVFKITLIHLTRRDVIWHHMSGKTLYIYIQVNSLAPGRFQFNFRWVIFKLTLVNRGWGISNEIALRWMPLDLTDDKPILVQVMAWCHQATSHYMNQCWPSSMSPYGITRPQWVNSLRHGDTYAIELGHSVPSHYLNRCQSGH